MDYLVAFVLAFETWKCLGVFKRKKEKKSFNRHWKERRTQLWTKLTLTLVKRRGMNWNTPETCRKMNDPGNYPFMLEVERECEGGCLTITLLCFTLTVVWCLKGQWIQTHNVFCLLQTMKTCWKTFTAEYEIVWTVKLKEYPLYSIQLCNA